VEVEGGDGNHKKKELQIQEVKGLRTGKSSKDVGVGGGGRHWYLCGCRRERSYTAEPTFKPVTGEKVMAKTGLGKPVLRGGWGASGSTSRKRPQSSLTFVDEDETNGNAQILYSGGLNTSVEL